MHDVLVTVLELLAVLTAAAGAAVLVATVSVGAGLLTAAAVVAAAAWAAGRR